MKILLISYKFYPDIGGIESISEILASEFYSKGHEIRVLTTSANKDDNNFSFFIIRKPTLLGIIKGIIWADVILENNICLRMSWPNIFFNKPIVVGLQTWIKRSNGTSFFSYWVKRIWLRLANCVVACSDIVRSEMFPKAIVIQNPYNEYTFRRAPLIKKTKNFVFVGRLVSDKGADLAIKGFQKFLEISGDHESSLTIVGDGEQRYYLEKMVEQMQLSKKVIFKGFLRGKVLSNYLNEFSCLLVPSLWKEPFGIVALEGMACGCIPIVADGGGLPEAIGNAGLVFSRGDVDDLAKCMFTVTNDPKIVLLLRKLAEEHLIRFHGSFIASQYLSLLNSIA